PVISHFTAPAPSEKIRRQLPCHWGFFEQKLSFEGRHLFDSLNKPAAKRSAAVVDPRRWNRTVHLTSEYVH
ncbi:hypothetical protein, partial [Aeromonas allosaccharophila]|uniref:hypothetical protein n=1 Tax=Aeromonas allosaccharophila TaxID=656 RepID=UPI003D21C5B0